MIKDRSLKRRKINRVEFEFTNIYFGEGKSRIVADKKKQIFFVEGSRKRLTFQNLYSLIEYLVDSGVEECFGKGALEMLLKLNRMFFDM